MADPKRHTVIEALKTRLQTITTANGFYNDLATRIDVWRVTPYLPAELPRVNITDSEDTLTTELINTGSIQDWQLRVNVYVMVPITAVLTLRKLIADIYNAVGGFRTGVDASLGGAATWVYPERDTIELDQEEAKLATATITLLIHYRYNKYAEA